MKFGLKSEVIACYERRAGRRSYLARLLVGWHTSTSRSRENSPSLSENECLSGDLSPNLLGHHHDV